MAAPVSPGDPLGIPTEAILAGERDSGAIGQQNAIPTSNSCVSPSEDSMTTRACTWRVSAPAGAASTTDGGAAPAAVHTSLTTAHRHRRLNGHRRVDRAGPGLEIRHSGNNGTPCGGRRIWTRRLGGDGKPAVIYVRNRVTRTSRARGHAE